MKEFWRKINFILGPIGMLAILAIFVVPMLVAINLTAKTRNLYQVLGTQDNRTVVLDLVGGKHRIITEEEFDDNKYKTVLKAREAGQYSKPILEIENNSSGEAIIEFYGRVNDSSPITLGLISEREVDSKSEEVVKFILADDNGSEYANEIKLARGEKRILYLDFKSDFDVSYSQEVVINFNIESL